MHHPVKPLSRHVHHLHNHDMTVFHAGDIKLQEVFDSVCTVQA